MPMWEDIVRQPDILGRLLGRGAELERFAAQALTPRGSGRLHLFGSGDGWFAARSACPRSGAGRCQAWSSLEFLLEQTPHLDGSDRALAISMSGNVDRTVEAAQAALAAGARVAALTNSGGRLAALGVPAFRLEIPELALFLCGTSSYTATLVALWKIGAAVERRDIAAEEIELRAILDSLPSVMAAADRQLEQLAAELAPTLRGVRFLAPGGHLPLADYGAAKLVELTRVPAWSDELEEFAHRQYWSMSRDELVVLLPADARGAAFAEATAAALAELPARTLALEPRDAAVPSARDRFAVGGCGIGAAVAQAVALQLFAYRLARATGTDPDRRGHLKQDETRFRVSRLLTRRSLVDGRG